MAGNESAWYPNFGDLHYWLFISQIKVAQSQKNIVDIMIEIDMHAVMWY